MKARPFIQYEDDEESQHFAEFESDEFDKTEVVGWIIGDRVVFTEDEPKFCPYTGIKLRER